MKHVCFLHGVRTMTYTSQSTWPIPCIFDTGITILTASQFPFPSRCFGSTWLLYFPQRCWVFGSFLFLSATLQWNASDTVYLGVWPWCLPPEMGSQTQSHSNFIALNAECQALEMCAYSPISLLCVCEARG